MADVATAEAPVTTSSVGAPVAAPESTPTPQVETTDGGQATESAVESAPQTPVEEAVPSLAELLKNPKFRDQYEGMTGERMRQATAKALQEAEQKRQQDEAQRFQWNEQQFVQAENQLRYQEDQQLRALQAAGDPFDITAHINKTKTRQDAWDANWKATQSQRQAYTQIQQQIQNAALQERAAIKAELDAHFETLPYDVKKVVAGREYSSRAAALADWRTAEREFLQGQHDADVETKSEAKLRQALAKANLNAEDFDLNSGTPVSGNGFHFAEDWEKAFANNEIDERQALRLRAQNLPRRNH